MEDSLSIRAHNYKIARHSVTVSGLFYDRGSYLVTVADRAPTVARREGP